MSFFQKIASVEIRNNDNTTVRISGLRIVFAVEKTEGKDPNEANIEIYNLSEDTRNRIKEIGKVVTLFAGYEDENGEEVLFIGDIISLSHKKIRPEVITTIIAQDGKTSLASAKTVISQKGRISAKTVLTKIVGTFNKATNLGLVNFPDKFYESGFSFAGLSRDALNKVTGFLDITWSIQNNVIKFVPFDGSDETGIVFLTAQSGLIGSPERLSGDVRKSKGDSVLNKPGWRFTSFLIPSLNPLGKVSVQSDEIPNLSTFIIFSVSHNGDTHGPDFSTVTEVHER